MPMTIHDERALIDLLATGMPRSRAQLNALHESDAELVALPGTDVVLAVTTDGVVEEIAAGLYRDPALAGWMVIAVNASDLAAVGAAPVGVLVSECLPPRMTPEDIAALQSGIRAAALAHGLPVLGGDTNHAPELTLTATAIGTVARDRLLTRRGARPGDVAFASGPLGIGTAFACDMVLGRGRGDPVAYRPRARLTEGAVLPGLASACMDTSDGVLATVDELMRVNGVGMSWTADVEGVLDPAAWRVARTAGLPAWTMLAGPHGEFELIFTVPANRCAELERAASAIGWQPLCLGTVTVEPGLRMQFGEGTVALDTAGIRSLYAAVGGDAERYLQDLLGMYAPRAVDTPATRV